MVVDARWCCAGLLLLAACRGRTPATGVGSAASGDASALPAPSTPTSVTAPLAGSTTTPPATSAGASVEARLPLDYPAVATLAKPGDHVLVPPRAWLELAQERGVDSQAFVFFLARMATPGPTASLVDVANGDRVALPNALIVPIRRGERVQPGDVVLTAWASGTGMQRGFVVEGGSPSAPRVHYLDFRYQHPSGLGKGAEVVAPDTFHRLREPGEPGTTLACRDGDRWLHHLVIHATAERWLTLGFAGRLHAVARSACRPLPLVPELTGGRALVPVLGVFTPARVRAVDTELGRAFVTLAVGADEREDAVGLINAMTAE